MQYKRGRPKKDYIRIHVSIDTDVFSQLELIIGDPQKQGFRYGSLSAITNRLYRKFLEGLRIPGVDPILYLKAYGVDISDVKELGSGNVDTGNEQSKERHNDEYS